MTDQHNPSYEDPETVIRRMIKPVAPDTSEVLAQEIMTALTRNAARAVWAPPGAAALPRLIPEPLTGPRAILLRRIADILRGDWSATAFDGRDSKRWIMTAIDGTSEEIVKLLEELHDIEASYG